MRVQAQKQRLFPAHIVVVNASSALWHQALGIGRALPPVSPALLHVCRKHCPATATAMACARGCECTAWSKCTMRKLPLLDAWHRRVRWIVAALLRSMVYRANFAWGAHLAHICAGTGHICARTGHICAGTGHICRSGAHTVSDGMTVSHAIGPVMDRTVDRLQPSARLCTSCTQAMPVCVAHARSPASTRAHTRTHVLNSTCVRLWPPGLRRAAPRSTGCTISPITCARGV